MEGPGQKVPTPKEAAHTQARQQLTSPTIHRQSHAQNRQPRMQLHLVRQALSIRRQMHFPPRYSSSSRTLPAGKSASRRHVHRPVLVPHSTSHATTTSCSRTKRSPAATHAPSKHICPGPTAATTHTSADTSTTSRLDLSPSHQPIALDT